MNMKAACVHYSIWVILLAMRSRTQWAMVTWLHGEAVAQGTILAAELSRRMGMMDDADVKRIRKLYVQAGLPLTAPSLGTAEYMRLWGWTRK